MADNIAILFNLCFLIFGAFLGLGIDMILHRWKDKKQIEEKKKKYIKSIRFELDTNEEILHSTYNKNLGILPISDVINGLISIGDLILFDGETIDEIMMYKKELEITSSNIKNPGSKIIEEFGKSNLYRATQKLKLQLINIVDQSTEQETNGN